MSKEKIYLSNKTPEKEKKKGGWSSFFLVLLALGAFFISPAPDYLVSLIPNSLVKSVISPMYQEITLSNKPEQLSQPRKYDSAEELNVLGQNSGLCLMFKPDAIDDKTSKLAFHGKEIAEVIALSTENKEYRLDNVTLDKGNNATIICQKFGLRHSITPDQIKALYIRPFSPLSPDKVKWVTMKDL